MNVESLRSNQGGQQTSAEIRIAKVLLFSCICPWLREIGCWSCDYILRVHLLQYFERLRYFMLKQVTLRKITD